MLNKVPRLKLPLPGIPVGTLGVAIESSNNRWRFGDARLQQFFYKTDIDYFSLFFEWVPPDPAWTLKSAVATVKGRWKASVHCDPNYDKAVDWLESYAKEHG